MFQLHHETMMYLGQCFIVRIYQLECCEHITCYHRLFAVILIRFHFHFYFRRALFGPMEELTRDAFMVLLLFKIVNNREAIKSRWTFFFFFILTSLISDCSHTPVRFSVSVTYFCCFATCYNLSSTCDLFRYQWSHSSSLFIISKLDEFSCAVHTLNLI